jgi:hypothetical protein
MFAESDTGGGPVIEDPADAFLKEKTAKFSDVKQCTVFNKNDMRVSTLAVINV